LFSKDLLEPYALWEKLIHFWFCTKIPFESLILVGYDHHCIEKLSSCLESVGVFKKCEVCYETSWVLTTLTNPPITPVCVNIEVYAQRTLMGFALEYPYEKYSQLKRQCRLGCEYLF